MEQKGGLFKFYLRQEKLFITFQMGYIPDSTKLQIFPFLSIYKAENRLFRQQFQWL